MEATALTGRLAGLEALALEVYAAHGLPTRRGHYARPRRSKAWRFVAESLTAEERFALVLAQKPGSGWRFAELEDLGADPDAPEAVRVAARVLRGARRLRTPLSRRSAPADPAEDLLIALDLGADERRLLLETLPRATHAPLKLTAPRRGRRAKT